MKYEVTVSVKKTYEIEADDVSTAASMGLDIFKNDSNIHYSVSAISSDSIWKSTDQDDIK